MMTATQRCPLTCTDVFLGTHRAGSPANTGGDAASTYLMPGDMESNSARDVAEKHAYRWHACR